MLRRRIDVMRSQKHRAALLGLVLIAVLSLTGCGDLWPRSKEPEGPANVTSVDEQGYTDVDLGVLAGALDDLTMGQLGETEVEAILYLREVEKLARDIFAVLGEQWGEEGFRRLAQSEDTHTEAIKALIDRYKLRDPSSVTWEGYFENKELLALYRQFVRQGGQSHVEALRAGATIEEISILDLREYRAETDDEDVQMVYENLLRASRNHLRAFVALIQQQGETYERQHLSQNLFDEIVTTPPEPGFEMDEDAK
jgi:hypothetical protein